MSGSALKLAPQERMPTDQSPIDVNEPKEPVEITSTDDLSESEDSGEPSRRSASPKLRGSRWVDYDTHELLEMISDLEDERRWARFREGIWLAILIHAALFAGIMFLPKYVFKVPVVVDKSAKLDENQEFRYMDTPLFQPKVTIKPVPIKPPQIDRQTLDEMNKANPPAPVQAPAPVAPPPPPQTSQQSPVEAPRPAAVPARPSFAMGSQNPADQLRDAMRGASRSPGFGQGNLPSGSGLSMHPGAGSGAPDILSDTQGVDFNGWLQRWHRETERNWDPLIPDEVNPPISKSGIVAIRFKVLPSGRLMDGSLMLEGRSGDVALDRAAWGALTSSNYPPLPRDFHGPYLELRAYFYYNMEPSR
jgi:hypothetical protein